MAESKLRKTEQNTATTTVDDIDRISDLPDSLLCHILSFLPTTTSVATTILSRRWLNLWQDLQVFTFFLSHFSGRGISKAEANRRLVNFINKVLAQRRARDIRQFGVFCCTFEEVKDSAATWVRAVVGPHLEKLMLHIHDVDGIEDRWKLAVPTSIFNCTKLVTLSLSGVVVVELTQLSSSVHLPFLKTLELRLNSLYGIDSVLSGCPVLEILQIRVIPDQILDATASPPKISAPKIRVPSLKVLTLRDLADSGILDLEIDTPSLEHLEVYVRTSCYRFLGRNLHNLVEARLGFCTADKDVDFALKFLKALCKTRFLDMYSSTVTFLLRAPVLDLPEFGYLLRLKLRLPYFHPNFVVNMLKKCPMLRVLTIEKTTDAPRSWTKPSNVPVCLISHLTFISFLYYGSGDDLEFISYILQEGLVLTEVRIYFDCTEDLEKHRIREELSLMPRGSKMCQLNFQ